MQGAGNDYVYIDGFREEIEDPGALAQWVSDRHFGIGSDGLVLILPGEKADFRMRMFNADGSEAEMCGNASRCVGKYVYEHGHTAKREITLETGAGIKQLKLFTNAQNRVERVAVCMGEPELKAALVPVVSPHEQVIDEPIEIEGHTERMTCVSMGNPHAVYFVEDVEGLDLEKIGPAHERHERFPRRTNSEFVKVLSPTRVEMRVWERGAGETLACGTGACATAVACVLNHKTERRMTVELRGGKLEIEWDEKTNLVTMTGPAVTVFEGTFEEPTGYKP